jgi:hypothetical protein
VSWQGETFCLTRTPLVRYTCIHVPVPYNIKLYTVLHSSLFDYRVRVCEICPRKVHLQCVLRGWLATCAPRSH